MIICSCCGRDINALGQDNMGYSPSYALCEDCAGIEEMYEMYEEEFWGNEDAE